MPHGGYALMLAIILAAMSWRAIGGRQGVRNRWIRLMFIAGVALVFPMLIKEMIVGLRGPERPMDIALTLAGMATWGAAAFVASSRKREVRETLRLSELEIDTAGIDENPRWVREQLSGLLTADDWKKLTPLVDAGWNGGFGWLTPELVREQSARAMSATADASRLPPPE